MPRDTLRKPGEHWYEVVEMFDSGKREEISVGDHKAYIVGRLDKVTIVEMEKGTTHDEMKALGKFLNDTGIEAIMLSEGVRFLKLRAVDYAKERELDEAAERPVRVASSAPPETEPST